MTHTFNDTQPIKTGFSLSEKQFQDLTNEMKELRQEIRSIRADMDAMKQAKKRDGSTWKTFALVGTTYGIAHLYFRLVLQTEHYYLDPFVPTGGYFISRWYGPEELFAKSKELISSLCYGQQPKTAVLSFSNRTAPLICVLPVTLFSILFNISVFF